MSDYLGKSPEGSMNNGSPNKKRNIFYTQLLGVIAVVFFLYFIYSFLSNKAFNWGEIGKYLFDPRVLSGVKCTIVLTVYSMFFGIILSVILALMRVSGNQVLRVVSAILIWFFRSVPLLVLLVFIFNIGLIYPEISISLPFKKELLYSASSQTLITPFIAAVITFSLHESAYGAEIVRSAISAVPVGQIEAAESLGINTFTVYRRTVFPLAFKMALPGLMNNLITMLKGTALVAFISLPDLMFSSQMIYMSNYDLIIPMLIVVTLWYFIMVSILTLLQVWVEKVILPGNKFYRGSDTVNKV